MTVQHLEAGYAYAVDTDARARGCFAKGRSPYTDLRAGRLARVTAGNRQLYAPNCLPLNGERLAKTCERNQENADELERAKVISNDAEGHVTHNYRRDGQAACKTRSSSGDGHPLPLKAPVGREVLIFVHHWKRGQSKEEGGPLREHPAPLARDSRSRWIRSTRWMRRLDTKCLNARGMWTLVAREYFAYRRNPKVSARGLAARDHRCAVLKKMGGRCSGHPCPSKMFRPRRLRGNQGSAEVRLLGYIPLTREMVRVSTQQIAAATTRGANRSGRWPNGRLARAMPRWPGH